MLKAFKEKFNTSTNLGMLKYTQKIEKGGFSVNGQDIGCWVKLDPNGVIL